MTQQILLDREEVNVALCVTCHFYRKTALFQFCQHESAKYIVGSVEEFHTCQHMRRSDGLCGPSGRLAQ